VAALSLTSLLFAHAGTADPIHAVRDGAYWHHDSGWIFPEKIEGFVRVGAPQDVAGSRDAVAYYAREENGLRTTASVDVYPKDSAIGPTTIANAKAAIELESPGAKLTAEGPFQIGEQSQLATTQATYIIAQGETRSRTDLYFVDAGGWLVKIRFTMPTPESVTAQAMDAFVRKQRWDTLLNPECTTKACDMARSAAAASPVSEIGQRTVIRSAVTSSPTLR
jgi:hypothetical protein